MKNLILHTGKVKSFEGQVCLGSCAFSMKAGYYKNVLSMYARANSARRSLMTSTSSSHVVRHAPLEEKNNNQTTKTERGNVYPLRNQLGELRIVKKSGKTFYGRSTEL